MTNIIIYISKSSFIIMIEKLLQDKKLLEKQLAWIAISLVKSSKENN